MSTVEMKSKKEIKANDDAAKNLNELFIDSLKDIYWAEKALTDALQKMSKNAHSKDLKTALEDHLSETEEHITRLEEVFEMIGEKAKAKKCEAMNGIIKESQDIMESTEPGKVRDAGIIAACQKAEHYEIATYGTLISWAEQLDISDVHKSLKKTLKEEKTADKKLADIATSGVNKAAKKK